MDLEKKVYPSYAFTENAREKANINMAIYNELHKKYRIAYSKKKYNPDICGMEEINIDEYDVVIERLGRGYGSSDYQVIKNAIGLSNDEIALICDRGNLCFGYRAKRKDVICIHED